MGLAGLSQYLLVAGAICLVVGFVMHVVHTTVLAAGRRAAAALAPAQTLSADTGMGTVTVVGALGPETSDATLGFRDSTTAGSIGIGMTWTGWILVGLAMLIRAYIVGRGPWGNMYEFSIAFAFGIVGGYLFLQRRYPIRTIGFVPIGVALFLLGYASTLPSTIEPLVPALQNPPLITIHVAMAMISYGIFATSFGAAVAYLVQGKNDRFSWLPSHKVLDEVAYRAVVIGFPIFATLIILGSYWASIAWGSLLELGSQGNGRAGDMADLRGLHARAQPARLGRPSRGADPGDRLRRADVHLLREPLLLGTAQLQRACRPAVTARDRSARLRVTVRRPDSAPMTFRQRRAPRPRPGRGLSRQTAGRRQGHRGRRRRARRARPRRDRLLPRRKPGQRDRPQQPLGRRAGRLTRRPEPVPDRRRCQRQRGLPDPRVRQQRAGVLDLRVPAERPAVRPGHDALLHRFRADRLRPGNDGRRAVLLPEDKHVYIDLGLPRRAAHEVRRHAAGRSRRRT